MKVMMLRWAIFFVSGWASHVGFQYLTRPQAPPPSQSHRSPVFPEGLKRFLVPQRSK